MKVENILAKNISSAGEKASYDAACKRLLANKVILAWIMKSCIEEYRDCEIQEIVENYIEGEADVADVPVNIDEQVSEEQIQNGATEDASIYEGVVTYDIRFCAKAPVSKEKIRLIINIEAQNDFYPGYPIISRGIYYCSRLISSQYGVEFSDAHYEKIKKVYSIWICMNKKENSMCHIHLTQDEMIGDYHWRGNLDLINIVMIGLAKELPEQDPEYELHRLLCTLFLPEIPQEERITILENEYDIPVEENFRKDVNVMCNLSQGVKEYGMMEEKVKVILKMHQKNYTTAEISDIVDIPEDEVQRIIEEQTTAVS